MAEQYIYSRSERGFVNARNQSIALGFGFVASSPGLSQTSRQDAAVHCEDCPRPMPGGQETAPIPLLRKVCLSRGQVLLQKSGWVQGADRDFHVAHGYVLDPDEVRSAGPAGWMRAGFRLEDPNLTQGGILLDSLSELPAQAERVDFGTLEDAARALGLGKESFCQLLLACFDALASRRLVLLAHDFRQREESRLRASILYWIYSCLPCDLWINLGFDSVYTEKSTPKLVQLAFVDRETLDLTSPRRPKILLGRQEIPLGGGFLVWEGQILHNDSQYKTDWYGQETAFARWLARNVDALWTCAELPEPERVWKSLQSRLEHTPESERLTPQVYGAASADCPVYGAAGADAGEQMEGSASSGEQTAGTDREQATGEQRPQMAGVDSPPLEEVDPAALGQLEDWAQRLSLLIRREWRPATDGELCLLSALECTGGRDIPSLVAAVLSAWAALEMGRAGSSPRAVLERYQALLPARLYGLLPYRIFWGGLSQLEQAVWTACGVKSGEDAAGMRRQRWLEDCAAGISEPGQVGRFLDALPGIQGVYRQWMEGELKRIARI